jgi:hypothetical protein
MDGGGAQRRLLATLAVTACLTALPAAPAAAQSPPAGTPKILLAFDASGSMATDHGAGTPKIDAAQDVIALVGGLALGALAIVVLALGRRRT